MAGKPLLFITLTADPSAYDSIEHAVRRMTEGLGKMARLLRKRLANHQFEYLAVWEATKQGWPHLHILSPQHWVPKGLLKLLWHQLTGSYIIDIRRIHNPDVAARYVAKYVAKGPAAFKGTKRYRYSRHYLPPSFQLVLPIDPVSGAWRIDPRDTTTVAKAWRTAGYHVFQDNFGAVYRMPPPEPRRPFSVVIDHHPMNLARAFANNET
jgi:hypothetical protein